MTLQKWAKGFYHQFKQVPTLTAVPNATAINSPPALKWVGRFMSMATNPQFWKVVDQTELRKLATFVKQVGEVQNLLKVGHKRVQLYLDTQARKEVSTQLNLGMVGPHADFTVVGKKETKIKGNLEVAAENPDTLVNVFRLIPLVDPDGEQVDARYLTTMGKLVFTSNLPGVISGCSGAIGSLRRTCSYMPPIERDTKCGQTMVDDLHQAQCALRQAKTNFVVPMTVCMSGSSDLIFAKAEAGVTRLGISCGATEQVVTLNTQGSHTLGGVTGCTIKDKGKIMWTPAQGSLLGGPVALDTPDKRVVVSAPRENNETTSVEELMNSPALATMVFMPSVLFLLLLGVIGGLFWHRLCCCCCPARTATKLTSHVRVLRQGLAHEGIELEPLGEYNRYARNLVQTRRQRPEQGQIIEISIL